MSRIWASVSFGMGPALQRSLALMISLGWLPVDRTAVSPISEIGVDIILCNIQKTKRVMHIAHLTVWKQVSYN